MKKVFLFSTAFLLLIASVCSCSDEQSVALQNEPNSGIKQMLDNFYGKPNGSTRSTVANIQIDGIERQTYEMQGDSAIKVNAQARTRAAQNETSTTFDLAYVSFHIGGKKGFSLLSDDERLNRVFFFTPNGCVADTADIPALKEYLDNIPQFAAAEIHTNPQRVATQQATVTEQIDPIVKTEWGQRDPFNLCASSCANLKCTNPKHGTFIPPIGCVNIAVAQYIAHCGKFLGTFYGNRDIDFKSLTSHTYPQTINERGICARFLHEIALCCQTQFTCDGSSTTAKAAYYYLNDLTYNCTYTEGGIDATRVRTDLLKGYPHLMAGFDSEKKEGHMWIIDGLRTYSDGTHDYWCNWGWGGSSNGWIYGNPYTAILSDGTTYRFTKNMAHIYTNSLPNY